MILNNDNDQIQIEIHAYIYRQFKDAHQKLLMSKIFIQKFKDKRIILLSSILSLILVRMMSINNNQSMILVLIEILILGGVINYGVAKVLAKNEYEAVKDSIGVRKELNESIINYINKHQLLNIKEGTKFKVIEPDNFNWVETYVVLVSG